MNRLSAPLRWRHVRWVLCAAVIPALWACNTRKLKAPDGAPTSVVQAKVLQAHNNKLDLLFMVDDSQSMAPLQTKMTQRLPDFMQALKDPATGLLPDLHVAVVTSSLGAGIYNNVSGCMPGVPGDDGGKFQHKPGCGLNAGETFIKATPDGASNNFTGAIENVFACIALVGDAGCGFEHQFESTRVALAKSADPNDPDNAGFYRPDALLGIVMFTNEDDCSVPGDSQLFDPAVTALADSPPLGGLWSYRCNEFGHKCDQTLPHTAVGLPMTLTGCVSKENIDGLYHLTPVSDFVKFFQGAKSPDKLLVAVIGGPYDDTTDAKYTVHARVAQTNSGTEPQPEISHSCTQGDGTFADPGVRLQQFTSALGGIFQPICANDFAPAMAKIAEAIQVKLGPQCVNGTIAMNAAGQPDCDVVLRTTDAVTRISKDTPPLANCASGGPGTTTTPCWQLAPDAMNCPKGQVLQLCYGAGCAPVPMTSEASSAVVSCALTP